MVSGARYKSQYTVRVVDSAHGDLISVGKPAKYKIAKYGGRISGVTW
jgi:NMD protein affecting ribosome stability and mRNA decay